MSTFNYANITLENLAAIISKKLKEHHIDSILVGGCCVSIYSHNRYQSYDAISICKEIFSRVDLEEIKRWSKNEDCIEEFNVFLQELKNQLLI